jgi:hypothetical protein
MKNISISKDGRAQDQEVEYCLCDRCSGTGVVVNGRPKWSVRWAKMSESAKAIVKARNSAAHRAVQRATKKKANNQRKPWRKEDEIFLCDSTLSDKEIAKKLGRPIYSIESKLARLLYDK